MTQQDQAQQQVPDEIIFDDLKTMETYTKMGRTATYNAIKEEGFPEPYQFGKRIVRWKRVEVLAWMETRKRGTRMTPVQRKQQQKVAA